MKIIRPVEVTDSIVTENTAYPPEVSAWESVGYAFIPDEGPVNQMEFSGSEDKLWVLIGGIGSSQSFTKLYIVQAPGGQALSLSGSNQSLGSISSEPLGSRLAMTTGGSRLSIYSSDLSVEDTTFDFVDGPVSESKIIWHGSHIYWMRRYTDGGGFWSLSKWTPSLTRVWEEIYDGEALSISSFKMFDVKDQIILRRTQNFDTSIIFVDIETRAVESSVAMPEAIFPNDAVMLPDLSAIYFTQKDFEIGLYKMTGAGYSTIARVIEPTGQPTQPGLVRASNDSSLVSVSSGFSAHIVSTANDTLVGGTERNIFKTYEEAPAIPFSRNDGYVAVHPKQPDNLGVYNLWETTGWTQITDSASDYLIGDTVYQGKSIYEALVDNPTQSPENGVDITPQQWVKTGSINPWRMFDGATNTTTSGASPMTVSFEPGVLVNGMALFSVDAGTLQVTMTDPVEGLVYDSGEIQMLDNSAITNWYAYFFEPYVPRPDIALLNLPPYPDAEITVTLTSEGQDVQVGEIVLGSIQRLGDAQYGTSVGIIDFSRKEQDQFGNFSILQRRFSKRAEYDVKINTGAASGIQRTLANYRTTPVVWVGDESKDETIVYGYYRDFEILLSGPSLSDCTITVEGL